MKQSDSKLKEHQTIALKQDIIIERQGGYNFEKMYAMIFIIKDQNVGDPWSSPGKIFYQVGLQKQSYAQNV